MEYRTPAWAARFTTMEGLKVLKRDWTVLLLLISPSINLKLFGTLEKASDFSFLSLYSFKVGS